ncbi:aldo/keto reductase [uncultured Thermanaerothrix sp.]|uniref:aldo/keto reductase n=1 Tax=uncultured Thermanaerothrix sp. TaxID=1195149 RepID=UPI0026141EDA|nr:aldo/keto reductase [uncultured Thermanaerothrix sp.]
MDSNVQSRPSVFSGVEMGVGTWSWGDRLVWGFGRSYQREDLREAFIFCVNSGLTFFDTAEVYGQGLSESLLGEFAAEREQPIRIATKFMPYPWRLRRQDLLRALQRSLRRLRRERVDLYQIHWPLPPVRIEVWMEGLIEAVQRGLALAVGVSNYNYDQMMRAYEVLTRHGIPLVSNQVEYHLLNRSVERNGILRACQELGITLIAYSPLAMGALTGKYTPENPPSGFRGRRYNRQYLRRIQPLLQALRDIGYARGGRTPAQVALNWLICKGALPIPGVKNRAQAEQNLGALGWRLSEEEVAQLDETSARVARFE